MPVEGDQGMEDIVKVVLGVIEIAGPEGGCTMDVIAAMLLLVGVASPFVADDLHEIRGL